MPTSNYAAFELKSEDAAGVRAPIALETVHVRDVTNHADLADLAGSDADGHVAAGTLPVAAGTTIHFYTDYVPDVGVGFSEIVTT